MASRRRPGRPPGDSRTREQIAAAARRQFAELGYERTTIRSIAKEAGVDPALVHHFFGSKQRLFLSVTELPLQPEEVLPGVLAGRRSEAGMRLARFSVELWESPEARERLARNPPRRRLRARGGPNGARARHRALVGAISESLGVDDAPLRASLISSQASGIMARCILRVEPLASMDPDALVERIPRPRFQNYLTGPFGPERIREYGTPPTTYRRVDDLLRSRVAVRRGDRRDQHPGRSRRLRRLDLAPSGSVIVWGANGLPAVAVLAPAAGCRRDPGTLRHNPTGTRARPETNLTPRDFQLLDRLPAIVGLDRVRRRDASLYRLGLPRGPGQRTSWKSWSWTATVRNRGPSGVGLSIRCSRPRTFV